MDDKPRFWAVFRWEAANMYRRKDAISRVYKSKAAAFRAADKLPIPGSELAVRSIAERHLTAEDRSALKLPPLA